MTTRRVIVATFVLGGLTLIACSSKTANKTEATTTTTTTLTEPSTVTTVPHPFLNITLDPQTSGRDVVQPVGGQGGAVACRSGAPLVRMHLEFPGGPNAPPSPGSHPIHLTHSYAHAGSYTVRYTDTVCELGDVSKAASVTVA